MVEIPLIVNKSIRKKGVSKMNRKLFKLTNFPTRSQTTNPDKRRKRDIKSMSYQEPKIVNSQRTSTSFCISNKQPIDHSSNRKAYSSRENQRELRQVCSQIDNWSFEKIFKQTQYYQEHRKFNLAMAKSKVGVNPEYFDKILRDSEHRSKSFSSKNNQRNSGEQEFGDQSIGGGNNRAQSVDNNCDKENDIDENQSKNSEIFKNKLYFQEERRKNNMKLVNAVAEKNLRQELLKKGVMKNSAEYAFNHSDPHYIKEQKKKIYVSNVVKQIENFKYLKGTIGIRKSVPLEMYSRAIQYDVMDLKTANKVQTKEPVLPLTQEISFYEKEFKKQKGAKMKEKMKLLRMYNRKKLLRAAINNTRETNKEQQMKVSILQMFNIRKTIRRIVKKNSKFLERKK